MATDNGAREKILLPLAHFQTDVEAVNFNRPKLMEDQSDTSQRSLSNQQWHDPVDSPCEVGVRTLCRELGVSPEFGSLLTARGLGDPETARGFLNPDESQLHPPFLLAEMDVAVRRILRAVENYEKILIFGDYDVDGTAGAVILYSYLKRLGARTFYYIPHRINDGYSFSEAALKKVVDWGVDLVITTDHGSTEMEAPQALKRHGIDLIITDHHHLGPAKPRAVAMVNPHQPGCPYPFKGLSAAGVAFKVIGALDEHLESINFWNHHGLRRTPPAYFLDLVALATVADMSPLLGENRVLVKLGLELLNSKMRPGLSGLVRESRIRGPITPNTITFKLAPKINALGKVGDPRVGMRLLLSHSFTESRRLARQMMDTNRERQKIEREVYQHAMTLMEAQPEEPATILVGMGWHPGVIGSIASRIAFQTHRPTVVLTGQGEKELGGSARGGKHHNVLGALQACQSLLNRFGGHRNAAGLALLKENLFAFSRDFQAAAARECLSNGAGGEEGVKIETWIEPKALTPRFLEELNLLSPFGFGNPEPVIGVRGFRVREPSVFNTRHLRFQLPCGNGGHLDAYAWDHSDWEVNCSQRYDIAFMPQMFSGPKGLEAQVRVLDLKYAD